MRRSKYSQRKSFENKNEYGTQSNYMTNKTESKTVSSKCLKAGKIEIVK